MPTDNYYSNLAQLIGIGGTSHKNDELKLYIFETICMVCKLVATPDGCCGGRGSGILQLHTHRHTHTIHTQQVYREKTASPSDYDHPHHHSTDIVLEWMIFRLLSESCP